MAKIRYLFLLTLVFFSACMNEKLAAPNCPSSSPISYSRDVAPIIRTNCAIQGCHVTLFEQGDFTKYEVLKDKADKKLLTFMIQSKEMPPAYTEASLFLSDCEINTILNWVDEGAFNN